jgi:hypothetical protein
MNIDFKKYRRLIPQPLYKIVSPKHFNVRYMNAEAYKKQLILKSNFLVAQNKDFGKRRGKW